MTSTYGAVRSYEVSKRTAMVLWWLSYYAYGFGTGFLIITVSFWFVRLIPLCVLWLVGYLVIGWHFAGHEECLPGHQPQIYRDSTSVGPNPFHRDEL